MKGWGEDREEDNLCMRRFTALPGTLSAGEDKKNKIRQRISSHISTILTAWPNLQLYRTGMGWMRMHGDGMDTDVRQSSQTPALEAEPCGSQKQPPESQVET